MHGISRIFTSAVDTVLWLAARSGQTELFSRQIWSCKATEAAPWEILSPFFQSLAVVPPVKYGRTVTKCECGCVCNSNKLFCHAHTKLTPAGFSCRISYLQIFGSDPDVFCDRNRRHNAKGLHGALNRFGWPKCKLRFRPHQTMRLSTR